VDNSRIKDSFKGSIAALTIISLWLGGLVLLLSLPYQEAGIPFIIAGVLWQTFLYTGLFITAHDAMHGTVFPNNRKINDLVGSLAVKLYALFSYSRLLKKHWEHHRHPASDQDPDFHDGKHPGLLRWYLHFMVSYVTWKQLLGMAIAFNILLYLFHVATGNLILFWILPSFLSTFQLFFFGTYLPHRELESQYPDDNRARSNQYSVIWSFISCYHFGYHWEHHEYPHIPWWRLPRVRRMVMESGRGA
jgi:beta-carotene ketolase (CrtW type)